MASSNILLYKIRFDQDYSSVDIVERIERDFLDETRLIVEKYDESSVFGLYIYSEIIKTKEYNFHTNSFEIITSKKFTATEFHIDMKKKYLDVWGNVKNAQKVIVAIALAFDNKISIDALELKFSKMIEYLRKEDNVYVNKVTARQIVLNDGLLADCTFDLSKTEKPFMVIEKYKDNIRKISFKWKCTDRMIGLIIHMSGTVTVYKTRESIREEEMTAIYDMLLFAGR